MFDYSKYTPDDSWSEFVIDDAKAIGALMGMDIENVYWSGFWSQGDGACFEGSLQYRKGCVAAVREYAPQDAELQRIAAAWALAHRRTFYGVTGSVKQRGHYQHEFCTAFYLQTATGYDLSDDAGESFIDIARDYMRWIYRTLKREYEYASAWQLAQAWQELADTAATERAAARQLIRDMRAARQSGIAAAASICAALRGAARGHLEAMESAMKERADIASNFQYLDSERKFWSVAEFAATHI